MKIKVTKNADNDNDSEDPKVEPKSGDSDDSKASKKVKVKGKRLASQYGTYSGIVDENGKTNRTPTEGEAITNMANYMKNNMPPAADNPSNVYRPQFSHIGMVYDRKKKQDNA